MRVLIPLMVRDQAIGLVQVQRVSHNREFSHREIRLAQALGSQAAIAIQNARLSTETADLVEESFLVNSLSQAIGATLNIDEAIAIVRDQVPGVAQAEQMYLALYDADTQTISFPMAVTRAGQTFSIPDRPLGNDEVSYVIRHRRSLALGGGNWSSDEMRRNMKISDGEGSARSYLGVPIAAGDQVLGVLAVRDMHNTRAFGINTERLLTTVGTQLGAAIQNARLFNRISHFAEELNQRVQERTQELEQERDRLDTLYQITSELARTLDMDRVLDRALEMVADAVNADEGVIMLIDPLSGELTTRASRLAAGSVYPGEHPAGSLASWLVDHQKLLIAKDLHDEPYWDISAPGAAQWHSALAVLLETNDDPQGVMVLLSREETAFSETQLKLVIAAANQVAAAINNADLYHLIRDQAERLGTLVRLEQEEAEKNSAIVEAIADGVLLADSEGAIKLFNSAAERILELPRDQVIGQAMFRLTGLFGGTAANWAKAIATWMRSPSSYEPGDYQAETINMAGKMVRIILSPVYTGERFIGTVAVFRDITKEIEADRIKSEFISNVSHELRTPMTSIKGFADLLLMGVAGPMPEAQRGFITKIKANSERLSQLVDDLLNISRLDSGAELQFEMLDVGQVVQKSVDAVREQHEPDTKDLQVYVDIAPDLPQIEADRKRIEQIVTNIVDNAFNYTYDGGRIDVRVAPGGDQQSVLISVADTGIGIPEEFQPRVWDRFARYDNHALVMDVPGTGLGLSIVRELVLMHNGNIWFESETGKGTTFFIRLPIYQPTVS
jgi:PAS domain S-box-containing protein